MSLSLEFFLHFDAAEVFQFFYRYSSLGHEILFHLSQEAGKIPFFRIELFVGVPVQAVENNIIDHTEDRIAQRFGDEDLAALPVQDLTLLIHDVVVFKVRRCPYRTSRC